MRLTWTLILMFHFIPHILAPPTSTTPTHSPTLTRHITSVSPTHPYTYRPPIIHPTRTHIPFGGTEHRPPGPTRTRGPDGPHRRPAHGQTPIVIFFEVLCGVLAVALFFGALRFCRSYRKTPRRDRILNVINRHRLQLELEELQRRPPTRRFSLQEPAPPYLPRPPSYDGSLPVQQNGGIHYAEIPSSSPPDSPIIPRRSLQGADTLASPPDNVLLNR
ncbi:hypothetical protein Hypma_012760 [Hypsizygus marmoreus]|uniref:Uncharacterized protein n=1 Tax=Hypsizygus marmoreus TaxID=39966 RepID=A0A369JG12_HYPMA|nr:hypothetical protein Hypma_012760 [Hypsizygus marmoreus]